MIKKRLVTAMLPLSYTVFIMLAAVGRSAVALSEKELAVRFDQDTETCREVAQRMHPADPNEQLDEFLLCIGNQVAKVGSFSSSS